jgi:hypothetical protein
MKKIFILVTAILFCFSVSAKKIKFAVNMSNEILNTGSIHVMGDFQEAAGYPYNMDPGSTAMIQETGDTNIYSIVVDVPAFNVYRYQFINGDQSYWVETVPQESRVNGAFDDRRWIYIDSTSDDTTFIGVLPFGMNAPVGLNLVVFRVNMLLQNVSGDSVHVAGDWQGWNTSQCMMLNFGDSTYNLHRYQAYLPGGTYHFKYANGNTPADLEFVSGPCSVNDGRELVVDSDMVLEPVNFGSCLVGISVNEFTSGVSMYPNPSSGNVKLDFKDQGRHEVKVADVSGRLVQEYSSGKNSLQITNLEQGMYTVSILNTEGQQTTLKLVVD